MNNELIKELLIKAGVYECDVNDPEFVVPEEQRKFAELLIEKIVSELQIEIRRSCRTLTYGLDDHIKMDAREDALDDALLIVKSILE